MKSQKNSLRKEVIKNKNDELVRNITYFLHNYLTSKSEEIATLINVYSNSFARSSNESSKTIYDIYKGVEVVFLNGSNPPDYKNITSYGSKLTNEQIYQDILLLDYEGESDEGEGEEGEEFCGWHDKPSDINDIKDSIIMCLYIIPSATKSLLTKKLIMYQQFTVSMKRLTYVTQENSPNFYEFTGIDYGQQFVSLYLDYMCSSPKYSGLSLSTIILHKIINTIIEYNYTISPQNNIKAVTVFAISSGSQHIMNNLGFYSVSNEKARSTSDNYIMLSANTKREIGKTMFYRNFPFENIGKFYFPILLFCFRFNK